MHWFTLVLRNQHLTQELSATTVPSQTCRIISKLAEHVVARRLTSHVVEFNLLPTRQSAYRPYHSTETAVLSVHNDLVYAIDNRHVSLLVLLDLSAAFDTVDHDILLSILANRFSIQGLALDWFRSYLANRTQTFASTVQNVVFVSRLVTLFAGCLLYAYDIVLLSGSLYGLQKMINICWSYGILWDIKFNPAKSLVTTFGGPSPISDIKSIEGSVIPVVNRVKYLHRM